MDIEKMSKKNINLKGTHFSVILTTLKEEWKKKSSDLQEDKRIKGGSKSIIKGTKRRIL